jgi:hypothetical protein
MSTNQIGCLDDLIDIVKISDIRIVLMTFYFLEPKTIIIVDLTAKF